MNRSQPEKTDERPAVAIGHVELLVTDVGQATEYFLKLGMRHIFQKDDFAVLELRGGTHLVLDKPEGPVPQGQEAPFDLMVDDIQAVRKQCVDLGFRPTEIKTGRVHESFTITGPDGYQIEVNSSHASGKPI